MFIIKIKKLLFIFVRKLFVTSYFKLLKVLILIFYLIILLIDLLVKDIINIFVFSSSSNYLFLNLFRFFFLFEIF